MRVEKNIKKYLNLDQLCNMLGISLATGKNWLKLGKISPAKFISNEEYFEEQYCKKLLNDLQKGKIKYLKSRRNKIFKSGFSLYKSYISKDSKNLPIAQRLIDYLGKESIDFSQHDIKEVLAYYSLQLLKSSYPNDFNKYKYLVEEIAISNDILDKYPTLSKYEFIYEKNIDILGLLYLSLNNISLRKSSGVYYTPTEIVNKLIKNTFENYNGGTVYDPCCGSGNFIINLPDNVSAQSIYAGDIDELSVKIARINFALKYKISDKNFLYEHIKVQNFLTDESNIKYDYIIGNPPWAFNFGVKDKEFLRKKYKTAKGSNIESYDVVSEKALNILNKNGLLSFILPEAVLNVKSHKSLREVIMDNCSIKYIEYLGDSFDGVQCPSIIIKIVYKGKPFSVRGLRIKDKDREFVIYSARKICSDFFSFTCDDKEYEILSKIEKIPNKVTLKGNAKFALGIVTGDNKRFLSKSKNKSNEFVLKGSDIEKYKIKLPKNYIIFKPKEFQQCAQENFYRAKEKLLYKFISKKLVFAYDNSQFLTLNSCNILIPQIAGLDIKYILGILNSNVAQFYYHKKFNSLKVLRSHIEQIPIPLVDFNRQKPIIDMVDKILSNDGDYKFLCSNINKQCNLLYNVDL